MKDTYIYSAKRTPLTSFNSLLASVPATKLGSVSIAAALQSSVFNASIIDECIMGNVLTAGNGQAPARQAAIGGGLSESVPFLTINKVCGSGLKAVMMGADSIALGRTKVAVVGGMESMSRAPHLMLNSRNGYRMGQVTLEDTLLKDGLTDAYNAMHMGNIAEMCVKDYNFSREAQDAFAINSYKKYIQAQADKYFDNEIVAVEVTNRKSTDIISEDEEPKRVQFDKIASLRAVFEKDGTITATNASKINDGGSALVIADSSLASEKTVQPLARIIAYESFSHSPMLFTTAPVFAMQKLLVKTGMKA